MEESRRLKLRFPNTVIPQPSLTDIHKAVQAFEHRPLYVPTFKTMPNQAPSVISLVILLLLHGISLCAGILWLIAPHLMNS